MFRLKAMLEAARAAVPSRPTISMKSPNASTSVATCRPVGRP